MFVNPMGARMQKKYIFFLPDFYAVRFFKAVPGKKNFFVLPKIENLQKGRHLL